MKNAKPSFFQAQQILPMLLFGLFVMRGTPAAAQGRGAYQESAAQLDGLFAPYVESNNFSGVILIASGDKVVFEKAYGMADLADGARNSPDTKFQIASISKSFTTASILLLWERGLLRLEDPVSRFMEDFPHGDSITVHHLLTHTSGLPRDVFFPDYREQSQKHHTTASLVRWFKDKPLAFPVGTRYGYSNTNFILLAHIIERISGQSYGEFLVSNIFKPLQLTATGHRGEMKEEISNMAKGRVPKGKHDLAPSDYFDYSFATGSGSLYSTARDLFRWYEVCTRGTFLNDESKAFMFGTERNPDGYAFHPDKLLDRDVYYATGWDGVGFSSRLYHFRNEGVTIIILCNLNMNNVASEILEVTVKQIFGEKPAPLKLRTSAQSFPSDVIGTYIFGKDFYVPGAKMTVRDIDGSLFIDDGRPGPPVLSALLQTEDGDFIHRQHWYRVKFLADGDKITGMQYDRFTTVKE